MNLQQFYEQFGHSEIIALSQKAGLNWRYLYQIRVGLREPSIEASDFRLTLSGLLERQLGNNPNRYWHGDRLLNLKWSIKRGDVVFHE